MPKKNFYLAFVLMLISVFLLTTLPTYANVELPQRKTYTKKSTKKKSRKKSSKNKSQGYPKWVGWTWKYKIINDDGQKKFKITVTYKNNSRDKIIKSIFNKTLTLSFKQCTTTYSTPDIKYKGKNYKIITNCQGKITSSRVNNCKLYPGESYALTYYIPFSSFNWRQKYNPKDNKLLKFKLTHTFQVQKENMNVD